MRRFLIGFLLLFFFVSFSEAGETFTHSLPFSEIKGVRYDVFGRMPVSVKNGDTIPCGYLRTIYVIPPEKFRSRRQERFYWKLVRDVKKVYPLSKIVYYTLLETSEYLETLPTEKEKEEHLKKMQKELIKEYMPELRKMTYKQGKILLKLIDRNCDFTSYDLIKAYRGKFTAAFWQGIARIFTANLKSSYNPHENKDDAMIERIVLRIENGSL